MPIVCQMHTCVCGDSPICECRDGSEKCTCTPAFGPDNPLWNGVPGLTYDDLDDFLADSARP